MLKQVGGDIFKSIDRRVKLTEKQLSDLSVEFATLYYTRLKENISKNAFGFSLAQSTLQKRKSKGIAGETPLIETGKYLSAILQKGTTVTMRRSNHSSGLSYEELWWILEYGRKDKSVPAFPVWRRTYEELLPEFKKLTRGKIKMA